MSLDAWCLVRDAGCFFLLYSIFAVYKILPTVPEAVAEFTVAEPAEASKHGY